jgi:hypothetical protein
MKLAFPSALALSLLLSARAYACEPNTGYMVPLNFELVEEADLIVLATVESAPSGPEADPWKPEVILHPIEVLKGVLPPSPLAVIGFSLDRETRKETVLEPTRLNEANPSSFYGACIRQNYHVGGMLIAMFRNSPNDLVQLTNPFAREVEDVKGPNDVWVRAVKLYVSLLSQAPGRPRRLALARAERELRRHPDDKAGQEIATDIAQYLSLTGRDRKARQVFR